jgi:hypothetical protein
MQLNTHRTWNSILCAALLRLSLAPLSCECENRAPICGRPHGCRTWLACCFQQHARVRVRSILFLPVAGDDAAHVNLGTAALFGPPHRWLCLTQRHHRAPSSPSNFVIPGDSVFTGDLVFPSSFIFPGATRSCAYRENTVNCALPGPTRIETGMSIFSHPWVTQRVPDTLLPL